MLHEKLEQASRETRHNRRKLALYLIVATSLLALFVFGVIRIDLATLGLVPDRARLTSEATLTPVPITPSSVTTREPPATGQTGAEPVDRSNPSGPLSLPDARLNTPAQIPVVAPTADPAARDRFMQAIAAFERDIEPKLAAPEFTVWDGALRELVLARKGEAVNRFGTGDYAGALTILNEAIGDATGALSARDAAFDEALAAAKIAADQDDYDRAIGDITEALRLRPESAMALALKSRIDALPAILTLIDRAAIARIENNLETEQAFLEQAFAADPTRGALAQRLDSVRTELREQRFAGLVEGGLAAIERRALTEARQALKDAEAVFAGRAETKLLARRIAALARDIAVERLTGKAEAAAASDDWVAAQNAYGEILKLLPGDKQAEASAELARGVISYDARITQHLAAPHRLSSPNVAAQVDALLADSAVAAAVSSKLAHQRTMLAGKLAAYTKPVAVRVVSDGATIIAVRGVGQIGATTGRTIELRPGRYTFEGARSGFKSKLVSIEIPPGATQFTVQIVCDERV